MNRFAEFMAQRKAWQIFLPIVAPLLVMQFSMVATLPIPAADGQPLDMTEFARSFRREMVVGILTFAFFISWLVSIGWVSNSRIDAAARPRMHWLLAAAAYAVAYLAFAGYYFFPYALLGDGGHLLRHGVRGQEPGHGGEAITG